MVFFVDLRAGWAVFTFQLNHPSTAERSEVPSSTSGCGGVWRYKFQGDFAPMLVAGETCYKPDEITRDAVKWHCLTSNCISQVRENLLTPWW